MPSMMDGKRLQSVLAEHFGGRVESLPKSVAGEYDPLTSWSKGGYEWISLRYALLEPHSLPVTEVL